MARAILIALLAFCATMLRAQGNYEIQVYGSDTVAARNTMVELHSNFTFMGTKPAPGNFRTADGQVPTEHALHETLEVTRGLTGWFEIGSYIFTSYQPQNGYQYVGSHIRPRVRVPDSWNWPLGVSLSTEVGYQRPIFSPDTWSWELRPIVDKKIDRWYFAFNPTFEKSLHGPTQSMGWEFTPNAKASFDFTKKITGGVEYYGALGPVGDFDPVNQQQQMIVPAIDLDLSPRWEFNFGVGVGVTGATDHLLLKLILGRRFGKVEDRSGKGGPAVEKGPEYHP